MRCSYFLILIWVGISSIFPCFSVQAGNDDSNGALMNNSMWQELSEGFDARINVVGFGIVKDLEESVLNTGNWLGISRYQAELDFRPDFNLNFRQLELSIKPRFEWRRQEFKDGILDGQKDTEDDLFVNEWLARLRLSDQLFVSYGRENLQWGPSYLLSPSNPFNSYNGRNDPRLEVPGMDFGRVVWIPDSTWTVSFIANTDEGRKELVPDFEKQWAYLVANTTPFQRAAIMSFLQPYLMGQEFKKTYAAKIDYTGKEKYFSLVPSHTEGQDYVLGFFGGWTATDALLLHTEGKISDNNDDAGYLIGGSYTLAMGPTISVEYYRQQNGCTKEPIERCIFSQDPDPTSLFVRKNYLLLQYTHFHIQDTINLFLRWICNIDDSSNQTIGFLEYELNDYIQLFIVGNLFAGGTDTEYGSLLNYSMMIGVSYTY